ncbi:MAG: NAD(P)H-hydrate dehydratase [Hyphomicrobiales bacterium]|nr:NAD(P)H-hydrate dehydratase [Hyphomicrobiales bacterium]
MHDAELLTTTQMRAADHLAMAAGVPGLTLMRRAGQAVAEVAQRGLGAGSAIGVLCGPGNNGGDGYVAAARLRGSGFKVRLFTLAPPRPGSDAAEAAKLWDGAVENAETFQPEAFDLVIDALLGAGLTRDVDGAAAGLIARLNDAATPVLAVDLPSGVDGDTGAVRGVAVKARGCVTFFRAKPGHYLYPGRERAGLVEVADIGIAVDVLNKIRPMTFANQPGLWRGFAGSRAATAHKYDHGHALVIAGGREGAGAARLAARAALRIGAGLVTLAMPPEAFAVYAARGPDALMLRAMTSLADMLHDRRRNSVLIGPAYGVGPDTRAAVLQLMATSRALVLDADALGSFAGEAALLGDAARSRASPCILTPHEGEFARLMAGRLDATLDKLSRARQAAQLLHAIVVLKGADTVIAAPDGRAAINHNAPPWLATAGSGDVLAGMITGLLAQGLPAFEAACAAVYLHGAAGVAAGRGLIADDLPEALARVLAATGGM